MKKTIGTTIFAFLISITVNSQITKSNWMVGGSGSYTQTKIDTEVGGAKYYDLTIRPNVGYFVEDNFAVGSALNFYRYQNLKDDNYSMNYGVGIFTRYYFLKPEKIFNIFTQVYFDKLFFETNGGSVAKGNGHDYGVKVGQVIFFNSSVGLEFSIDYEKRKFENNDSDIIKFGLGFQVHLER